MLEEKIRGTIRRILAAHCELGELFARMRDKKLFRAEYKTFDEYCQEAHGLAPGTGEVFANAFVVANKNSRPRHVVELVYWYVSSNRVKTLGEVVELIRGGHPLVAWSETRDIMPPPGQLAIEKVTRHFAKELSGKESMTPGEVADLDYRMNQKYFEFYGQFNLLSAAPAALEMLGAAVETARRNAALFGEVVGKITAAMERLRGRPIPTTSDPSPPTSRTDATDILDDSWIPASEVMEIIGRDKSQVTRYHNQRKLKRRPVREGSDRYVYSRKSALRLARVLLKKDAVIIKRTLRAAMRHIGGYERGEAAELTDARRLIDAAIRDLKQIIDGPRLW